MIGDDWKDDVGGAHAAVLHGILVRTGKYQPGDEDKVHEWICQETEGGTIDLLYLGRGTRNSLRGP